MPATTTSDALQEWLDAALEDAPTLPPERAAAIAALLVP